jgi:hypothetical protein
VPDPIDVLVDAGGHTVLGIGFKTDRAPYVVKNEARGKQGGGAVEFEVPWREMTRIRTARRSELLLMLDQATQAPTVEALSGCAKLTGPTHAELSYLRVDLYFYLVPHPDRSVVLPIHKCGCIAWRDDREQHTELLVESIRPRTIEKLDATGARYSEAVNSRILLTPDDVSLSAPCVLKARCRASIGVGQPLRDANPLRVALELNAVGSASPTYVELEFTEMGRSDRENLRIWLGGEQTLEW